MRRFKDTFVGASTLKTLLDEGKAKEKEAKKCYQETTERYNALYPEADRQWFLETMNKFSQKEKDGKELQLDSSSTAGIGQNPNA